MDAHVRPTPLDKFVAGLTAPVVGSVRAVSVQITGPFRACRPHNRIGYTIAVCIDYDPRAGLVRASAWYATGVRTLASAIRLAKCARTRAGVPTIPIIGPEGGIIA